MKRIGINLLIGYGFVLLFIAFIPFKNLFFLLEKSLQKRNLFINEQAISSLFVHQRIDQGEVYFEDIKALFFEELTVNPWLIYNQVGLYDIKIAQGLKDFLPLNIDFVKGYYTLFYPHKIFLSSSGDYGQMAGEINLWEQKVVINISASTVMRKSYGRLLALMTPSKEPNIKNGYVYEYRF